MKRIALAALAALAALVWSACSGPAPPPPLIQPRVSSTLAISADDRALWVVNPDSDSVSLLDPVARTLVAEILLGDAPPTVDAAGRYEPAYKPRALALTPDDRKLYVAAQAANVVVVIDTAQRRVLARVAVGAEPTGVVATPDGRRVYAVSHEAATVAEIDPATDQVVRTLAVGEHPWGVAADGKLLYVSQFLLAPGVTVIEPATFTVRNVVALADQPPGGDKRIPNGQPRGLYIAAPRPVAGDIWVPHLLLATATAQPELDFESTVFPTISTLRPDAYAAGPRFLFQPLDPPGASGSFTDVVSGPRAVAFTPDGRLALIADAASEDVLVLEGATGGQRGLVRPLPGAFLEGIVVSHDGAHAYVDGRATLNVTVLALDYWNPITPALVDGAPIPKVAADPMPAQLRLGQRLFYSANSAAYPLTRNFWVACASCHLEARTDAVTWRFATGPRDTPSNAGGPINTGFLMRQALRSTVTEYDTTINVEQGGNFHRTTASQQDELDALAAFVNFAVPFPQNPYLAADGKLTAAQAHGRNLFVANCTACHDGAYFTDSGVGNPTLDLAGSVVLHDIGTCVVGGAFPDQPSHDDEFGMPRTACDFDTPTLRGVFATAPYFHDGSAATLRDAVDRVPFSRDFSDADKDALVEYLKTL
jgi:YVTN family beta-propeller protein